MKYLLALLSLSVASLAALANHAHIDANHVLEIDGKKIFVIGFTLPPPVEGKAPNGKPAIDELADSGATFLRAGPLNEPWDETRFESEKKYEDAAAAHGMHCWLNLREAASIKEGSDNEALLKKIVTTFRDHPGLGAYKGVDEPEWGKHPIPPMKRAYDLVKELDPNHPMVLIEAPRGTINSLKAYNPVCDIVGIDIYPIGYPPGAHSQFAATNSEISMVGDYTRMMRQVAATEQPVWMTLQVGWSGVVKPGKTLRFPTFPEERFMVYQAIINGARGLMFFGGSLPQTWNQRDQKLGWNWRFWERVLKPIIEEIGSHSPLYPALVGPESKQPIKVKASGIEYCTREADGALFILACNRSQETVKVEFAAIPAEDDNVQVMFEEPRVAKLKGHTLVDWFAPFEVHVYRIPMSQQAPSPADEK